MMKIFTSNYNFSLSSKYQNFVNAESYCKFMNFKKICRLQGRVDRMENSIQPMSHKIDLVLSRIDGMFKKRKLKKTDMEKIFEGITNSEGTI